MNIKRNTSSFKEKNRVSFFDNIFYWIWTTVPSKGFPDRSFVVVTVCQFSYVLLFVSILLTLFDDQVQLCIYDKPEPIAIPMLIYCYIMGKNLQFEKKNTFYMKKTYSTSTSNP